MKHLKAAPSGVLQPQAVTLSSVEADECGSVAGADCRVMSPVPQGPSVWQVHQAVTIGWKW